MLVALLFLAVTSYVIYDPSFLTEDDRPLLYLAVFSGPFIGAWGLWHGLRMNIERIEDVAEEGAA